MDTPDKLAPLQEHSPKAQLSVPPGWEDIVLRCHERLLAVCPGYAILQVKEKFGGLRYYTGSYPTELRAQIDEAITSAEREADVTCEVCGEPGTLEDRVWARVTCPKHQRKTPA